ncbi:MAG TPA: hypothetical protein VIQ97_00540 [Prevotella sp.]
MSIPIESAQPPVGYPFNRKVTLSIWNKQINGLTFCGGSCPCGVFLFLRKGMRAVGVFAHGLRQLPRLLPPTVGDGGTKCHGWLHQVPRLIAPSAAVGWRETLSLLIEINFVSVGGCKPMKQKNGMRNYKLRIPFLLWVIFYFFIFA